GVVTDGSWALAYAWLSALQSAISTTLLATVPRPVPDLVGSNTAATEIYTLSLHDALPISGKFEIDPATGAISLKAGESLDYETAESHGTTVRFSDGPGLYDDVDVTIKVTDVNEAPTLTVDATPVSVAENTAAGTLLADVDGTDPDTLADDVPAYNDAFNDLTYSIVSVDGFSSG